MCRGPAHWAVRARFPGFGTIHSRESGVMNTSTPQTARWLPRWPVSRPCAGACLSFAASVAFVVTLSLVTRWFSVSCAPDIPCVTLSSLQRGTPLPEAIHLYDRYGNPMADVAGPLRRALPSGQIPDRLANAWVAVEDRRFWDHGGVDVRGIFRAATHDLATGELEEGASTIAMQLVRTLWGGSLRDVGAWHRKIIEARTAPRLVDELGRRRVLELYLNSIYLGNGLYGVDAASRYYFGVPADSMDLAQTATLVGMTRAPELYEPRRHPERALRRRNVVLRVLADAGVATEREVREAEREQLGTVDEPDRKDRRTYATAAVMRAIRRVAPDLAGRPGLRVFTTLDPEMQEAGVKALRHQIEAIEEGRYGPAPRPDSSNVLQGAAIALDPATGAIRAWIGGRDFQTSEFDRVSQARRQVGSLVKPLLVSAALEEGYGILDPVSSDTISIQGKDGVWSPADHVGETVLPMREALVHSSNRAAVHLGLAVGVGPVRKIGRAMGIGGPIEDVPSTFLGSFGASLLEMTGAYAVFDRGGLQVDPYLVARIEDRDGGVLWERQGPDSAVRILSEATTFVVLDALREVVDRGTGYPVRAVGFDGLAAGKTGTTDDVRDAWFIGLTPGLVAGVWIGFDHPRTIVPGGSGGRLAGPVWARWLSSVHEEAGDDTLFWTPPPGVERVRYDPSSGAAFSTHCWVGGGPSYPEGWVHADQYPLERCPGGVMRWLDGLWRALVPPKVTSLRRDTIGR